MNRSIRISNPHVFALFAFAPFASSRLNPASAPDFRLCPVFGELARKSTNFHSAIGHFRTFSDIKMGRISQSFGVFASISPLFHNVALPPTPPSRTFSDIFGHLPILHADCRTISPVKIARVGENRGNGLALLSGGDCPACPVAWPAQSPSARAGQAPPLTVTLTSLHPNPNVTPRKERGGKAIARRGFIGNPA